MSTADSISIPIPRSVIAGIILDRLDGILGPAAAAEVVGGTPAIGAALGRGIYAGMTIHEEKPYALILLPGEAESVNWKDAIEWAKQQGGELPSRFDQLVLFKNLKREFKDAWYWSGASSAQDDVYAWSQGFYFGNQGSTHKSYSFRARAVRRLVIE